MIQLKQQESTFNNYFYLFSYLYITRITINNNAPHLKSPKNQNRRAALGRPAVKLLGGGCFNKFAVDQSSPLVLRGWAGGAMVLGKLPVPGRPTIWITVGQGPTALAVGAGGGCLEVFTLIYPFSPLSPSLWGMARYRLNYCLKGPINPKQPTNQPTLVLPWFLRHLVVWFAWRNPRSECIVLEKRSL